MNYLDKFSDLKVKKIYDYLTEECGIGYTIINYDDGDLDDIFHDIADNSISIYNYDLARFAGDNPYYMEQAVREGFTDLNNYDFYGHCSGAQYLFNCESLYDNREKILKLRALYYCLDNKIDISESQMDLIFDINFDKISTMNDLFNYITDALEA